MCRNNISSHLVDHVMHRTSSASLPERHIRVPKQSYIDFSDNFIVSELVFRRVVHYRMPYSSRALDALLRCRNFMNIEEERRKIYFFINY